MTAKTLQHRHRPFPIINYFILFSILLSNCPSRVVSFDLSEVSESGGLLNNDSKEDIYVKSVAINGKIAGNSVSVSVHHSSKRMLPAFETGYVLKGRRKRGEMDENAVLATKVPPRTNEQKEKLQKDEPEEGKKYDFMLTHPHPHQSPLRSCLWLWA